MLTVLSHLHPQLTRSNLSAGPFAALLRLVACGLLAAAGLLHAGNATAESYSLAVVPDTQLYSRNYPEIFDAQTTWLAANQAARDIVFTIHLGDLVEYGANDWEWDNADHSMGILDDADMPYAVVPGNHDLYGDNGQNYRAYFGPDRFSSMPTYGGHSPSGMSQYHVAHMGEQDLLMLSLDIDAPDPEMQWAQSVLDAHPTTPTVLTTHLLMDPNGNIRDTTYIRHSNGNPAQTIWDDLVMPNEQIFLTLNGHYHGTRNELAYNAAGLEVHRIVVDYQGFANGGNGYLRMMEFDFDQKVIRNTSYSPTRDDYLTDETNEFALQMDFERRFAQQVEIVPQGTLLGGNIHDFSSFESRKGGRSVDQLVSGAGIVDHLGQEAVTLDATHADGTYDAAADGMWTSYANQPIDEQYVIFDLGRLVNLDQVAVWQFGEAFDAFDFTDQGAKEIRILATDVVNPEMDDFTELQTITLDQHELGQPLEAQLFDLIGADGVRYVKFDFVSNWGNPSYVGLSEVRFVTGTPIPEPTTVVPLIALSAMVLGGRRPHQAI